MWRHLGEIALGLGGIYLGVSFAVPLVFAGVAFAAFGKQETQGLAIICTAAALISAFLLIPPYFETVSKCQDLERNISMQNTIERLLGTDTVTQEDLDYASNKCADLPFAKAAW